MNKMIYICSLLVISSLVFTQAYISCLPEISRYYAAPSYSSQIIFMSNLLLFGISQLFYGPMSDRLGRAHCLKRGLMVSFAGNMISAAAPSIWILFLGQCLSGIGSGACSVIPRAILKDELSSSTLVRAISILSMSTTLATGMSPIIGSTLSLYFGWRSIFLLLALIAISMWFLVNNQLALSNKINRVTETYTSILKNYLRIFSCGEFRSYSVLNWCCYSSIIVYLLITPFIFQKYSGYSITQNSYVYLSCAISYFLANAVLNYLINDQNYLRLIFLGLSVITMGCSLAAAPWLTHSVNAASLILSGILINFGAGVITPITFKMALSTHGFSAGMASAAISASRIIVAFFVCSPMTMLFASDLSTLACFLLLNHAVACLTFYFMKTEQALSMPA